MNNSTLQKARQLYDTIRELQASILLKNAPLNTGLECAAKELTLPQMSTMAVIRDAGEMTIKELAEATRVSSPSASAMVDRLVDLGVITREPGKADRREVCISLAPEGEAAVTAMEGQILSSIVYLMEKLGPEYTRQWCDVYGRIHEILDEEREAGRGNRDRAHAVREAL